VEEELNEARLRFPTSSSMTTVCGGVAVEARWNDGVRVAGRGRAQRRVPCSGVRFCVSLTFPANCPQESIAPVFGGRRGRTAEGGGDMRSERGKEEVVLDGNSGGPGDVARPRARGCGRQALERALAVPGGSRRRTRAGRGKQPRCWGVSTSFEVCVSFARGPRVMSGRCSVGGGATGCFLCPLLNHASC
jgi:hypothetical protein